MPRRPTTKAVPHLAKYEFQIGRAGSTGFSVDPMMRIKEILDWNSD
jgi:hypothetical protein